MTQVSSKITCLLPSEIDAGRHSEGLLSCCSLDCGIEMAWVERGGDEKGKCIIKTIAIYR